MANMNVRRISSKGLEGGRVEYVERKGVGHPDSLIDGIVDRISVELCKEYLSLAGTILHHNVDKGLIVGGASKVAFGDGRITKKIEVILAGRATESFGGKKIGVNEIAKETAAKYLKNNTRFLDIDKEVTIDSKIAMGSADLTGLFMRGDGVPLANDTSFGIGFAPFSDTESLVLETEKYLNSAECKKRFPAIGEDIKVMGFREDNRITLTVAIAFVSRFINDLDSYADYKERVKNDLLVFADKITDMEVEIYINTGDDLKKGEVYITKSGLSCESGDDGEVGRGNRVNGLITPFRQMSLEAAAGKNPVNHIGKIYNIFANEFARDVVKTYPEIKECDVAILSQIGRRIDEPKNFNIGILVEDHSDYENLKGKVNGMAEDWLLRIKDLTTDIAIGKYKTF
jgi:S-adenosylmethionine synthetase